MAMIVKIAVLWYVNPCSLVDVCQLLLLLIIEETFWKPCRKILIQKGVKFIQTVRLWSSWRPHEYWAYMNLRKPVCVNEHNCVFSKLLDRYVSCTWLTRPRKRSLSLNVQNGKGSHERLYRCCMVGYAMLVCSVLILYHFVSEQNAWNKPVCVWAKDAWMVVQVFTFIKHGGREVMYGNMLVKYSAFVETIM